MDSYVTKLQEIEIIAGDSGIVLEFQVFYEDGGSSRKVYLNVVFSKKYNFKSLPKRKF